MVKIYSWYISQRQQRRARRAIRKANWMFEKTGAKFFCLWYNGKPLVKSKQNLKELIKDGTFKKGLTIHDIEALAFFVTR
jgi:hypothetical protein